MNTVDVLNKMESIKLSEPIFDITEDEKALTSWKMRWEMLKSFLAKERKKQLVKIAVFCSDFGAAANIGGPVHEYTRIVEVESPELRKIIDEHTGQWTNYAISIVKEGSEK